MNMNRYLIHFSNGHRATCTAPDVYAARRMGYRLYPSATVVLCEVLAS